MKFDRATRRAVGILVLLCASTASALSSEVIGGTPLDPPPSWMVAVCRRSPNNPAVFDQVCGGSLIDGSWVLTAAHCFGQATAPEDNRVVLGVTSNPCRSNQLRELETIILNPRFRNEDGATYFNDLALMLLEEAVDAEPLAVMRPRLAIPSEGSVLGWGNTTSFTASSASEESSGQLMGVVVPVFANNQRCQEIYATCNQQVTRRMICAGEHQRGACSGDSGGPLVVRVDGEPRQLGIVSFGPAPWAPCDLRSCGLVRSVFTRVSSYLRWISCVTEALDTSIFGREAELDASCKAELGTGRYLAERRGEWLDLLITGEAESLLQGIWLQRRDVEGGEEIVFDLMWITTPRKGLPVSFSKKETFFVGDDITTITICDTAGCHVVPVVKGSRASRGHETFGLP